MTKPRNDDEARIKMREMINDIGVAMFVTHDGERLRSRPMQHMAFDEDGRTLWYFTKAGTPKVDEIGADGRVMLGYSAPNKQDYVSVSGQAEVLQDEAKAKAIWSEAARVWFPDGPSSPDLALIKVTLDGGEYWDANAWSIVYAYGYAKAMLTGKPPEGGEIGKARFAAA